MRRPLLLAVLVAMAWPPPAAAYVYYSQEQVIASFFQDVPAVQVVPFAPDASQAEAIRARLGYRLPKPSYDVFVGTTGYALIDEELGQHEPITFGILLDDHAVVRRIEVMTYREAYGDGIRSPAFREQFTGLGADAPMRVGKEIRIVSGATISSRAVAVATRRACVLVEAFLAART